MKDQEGVKSAFINSLLQQQTHCDSSINQFIRAESLLKVPVSTLLHWGFKIWILEDTFKQHIALHDQNCPKFIYSQCSYSVQVAPKDLSDSSCGLVSNDVTFLDSSCMVVTADCVSKAIWIPRVPDIHLREFSVLALCLRISGHCPNEHSLLWLCHFDVCLELFVIWNLGDS